MLLEYGECQQFLHFAAGHHYIRGALARFVVTALESVFQIRRHAKTSMVRTCGITGKHPCGMLKKASFSPAQPRRILHPPALRLPRQPLRPGTRLVPSKAAALRLTLVSRFTPYVSRLLGVQRERRMGKGASRRAWVGRVRSLAFLSILLANSFSVVRES